MSNFERRLCVFLAFILVALPSVAEAQQQLQGFAVERFYPSAPGSGWFVMDDLNMAGGFGGAVSMTTGYALNPFRVTSPDGTRRLSAVSDQAFIDVGVAGTYNRYRVYLNFPMPMLVNGSSGVVGPYQLNGPSVGVGSNPDTISDPRVGVDMRLLGTPGSSIRLGLGAQLVMPSGDRSDYVTDGTYRGMFRFLAAGDAGHFSYAGQLGVHVRSLNESPVPNSPYGNEFLLGLSGGRRLSMPRRWDMIVGPEIYGETAFQAFLNGQRTGMEGLLTGRLERTGDGPQVRIKLGAGHGIVQHFGAPEWRVLFGVELFGHRSASSGSPRLP
jgi:hypothetical protein